MRVVPEASLSFALKTATPRWISSDADLSELRKTAFTALQKIGLPHSGSEDFTFIRVGEFLPHLGPPVDAAAQRGSENPSLEIIQSLIFPESRESYIVLVDGSYAANLSKPGDGYHVSALGTHLPSALLATLEEETDAAAALATLFARQPLLIEIATKAVSLTPLQILHYRTNAPAQVAVTSDGKVGNRCDAFVVIHAGKLSESRLLVRHTEASGAPEADAMINVHTLALLEEGASLQFMESGSEAENRTIHFRKLTARLERSSCLTTVSAHTGSRLMRNSFSVDLMGEGAEAEINGATVLTEHRQSHNFLRIRHLVPHCTSRQHFKSVAADTSRSSVDGTIIVARDAQGTNAYQLINNLMLSDEARTDSKPQLMIHADDVKCSHGATTGKLDPTQQFYLESRGLNPMQARTLMTVAFIAEILDKVGTVEAKENATATSFRSALDHALLDTLKLKLPTGIGGAHA